MFNIKKLFKKKNEDEEVLDLTKELVKKLQKVPFDRALTAVSSAVAVFLGQGVKTGIIPREQRWKVLESVFYAIRKSYRKQIGE